MIGFDSGIKLGSNDGKVLGTILESVDGITLEMDAETDIGSLD